MTKVIIWVGAWELAKESFATILWTKPNAGGICEPVAELVCDGDVESSTRLTWIALEDFGALECLELSLDLDDENYRSNNGGLIGDFWEDICVHVWNGYVSSSKITCLDI